MHARAPVSQALSLHCVRCRRADLPLAVAAARLGDVVLMHVRHRLAEAALPGAPAEGEGLDKAHRSLREAAR